MNLLPEGTISGLGQRTGEGAAGIPRPATLTKENAAFVRDIARWQDDLANGFEEKGWQEQATQASEMRANGDFDEWKEETEKFWGQKMKGGKKTETKVKRKK